MDLNKIRYFLSVADQGTISKAGQLMGISQPALSLLIQGLEEELGLQLFERGNRGLDLTEEGTVFYGQAVLLKDWERETLDLLEGTKEAKGKISIGTYTTASSYLISPLLNNFFHQYPDIRVSYNYEPTNEILQKLENGQLDCAIVSDAPERKNLLRKMIYQNQMVLVAPRSNKSIPKEINPAQLKEYRFLSYPVRNDYCYASIEKKFGHIIQKCKVPVESESFDTLKQSLISGLGISFMPEYLVRKELAEKTLKRVQINGVNLPIQFYFITNKKRVLAPKLKVFRDHIVSSLSKL